MDLENESVSTEADDFDLTAALSAEFDKAESGDAEPVETASEAADRVRDDKGRFAAKTEEKEADEKAAEVKTSLAKTDEITPAEKTSVAPAALPDDAVLRPPNNWSPAAKVAFGNLPQEVKQAIAERETQVEKGFEEYRRFKPIEKYEQMARESGTTLDKALESYVGIEQVLRQDFVGGIAQICQRQGMDPVQLANTILSRAGVSGRTDAGDTASPRQDAGTDLTPVMQKITQLESYIQQQQQSVVQTEIQRFASNPKNMFFDNVKTDMGRLIDTGIATDLDDAYDKACQMNKEIRQLLVAQNAPNSSDASAKAAAATQARNASKSITGSPVHGSSARTPETSIEDEIRELMNAAV